MLLINNIVNVLLIAGTKSFLKLFVEKYLFSCFETLISTTSLKHFFLEIFDFVFLVNFSLVFLRTHKNIKFLLLFFQPFKKPILFLNNMFFCFNQFNKFFFLITTASQLLLITKLEINEHSLNLNHVFVRIVPEV